MNVDGVIKDLEAQVEYIRKNNDVLDGASFGYEEGVLISALHAEILINAFNDKHPIRLTTSQKTRH